MPFISNSKYRPTLLLRNSHFNTVYANIARSLNDVVYERQRLDTPDGDFLDLDWSRVGSDRLVFLLHGLEGSTQRPYTRGMIRYFNQQGWDGVGMNFRGCSGEPNRLLRTYHVGETGDVHFVLEHLTELDRYREIVLIGFSLGGNVTLKYVGEQSDKINPVLKKAVAFSVPCHVPSANVYFNHWQNTIYMQRFMKPLNEKFRYKAIQFPHKLAVPERLPRNFDEFDELFTAPVHGFDSAMDYWTKNSSLQFLDRIRIPTLLVNAVDDTFLSPACYPGEIAEQNEQFYLEMPKWGGHCGFANFSDIFWSERRAFEFVNTA